LHNFFPVLILCIIIKNFIIVTCGGITPSDFKQGLTKEQARKTPKKLFFNIESFLLKILINKRNLWIKLETTKHTTEV